MADAIWPVTLPKPRLTGYGVSDTLPVIRTDMESGPARVTRISGVYMTTIQCSFLFDRTQAETFRLFFEDSAGANAGADWFILSIDTGGGVIDHRVRFTSGPAYSFDGAYIVVTASLETEEQLL